MRILSHLFKGLKKIFFSSYVRGFITLYALFMITGATFLKLPFSLQSGESLSWIDAFFVSASALSTTGLSPIVVKDVFTPFGLTILILIIQIGGIGLIMMVALFWLVVRKNINFSERSMLTMEQNQLSKAGIVKFVRSVLIVIFSIEIIAFLVMSIYLITAQYFPVKDALFQAFFTTISLFTNAGFDIAPNADSFQMYRSDYFMQTLAMGLMFAGAVGFWPLFELKEFIFAKMRRESFKFSLFTRILVFLHLGLWIFSAVVVFMLERQAFLLGKDLLESIYYALFMTLTTRNAGFSTMDVTNFTSTTKAFITVLMYIGSSPNSAGGGIRTTTLLLAILGTVAFAKGKPRVVIRFRSIKEETILKSFIVIFTSIILIGTSVVVISLFENLALSNVLFEVTSAFGTTGLSTGVTTQLGNIGKTVLVFVMFIGRIGILPLLLMFKPPKATSSFIGYPTMDIIIG